MTSVIADISMSLDGFVTGPDPDVEPGLGHGGEPQHTWAIDNENGSTPRSWPMRPGWAAPW